MLQGLARVLHHKILILWEIARDAAVAVVRDCFQDCSLERELEFQEGSLLKARSE
jgi:hypothetical protein